MDNLRDKIRDAIDRADQEIADRTGKKQTGFDPDVCAGCPHRGGAPLYQCGLCGCPTLANFPLHQRGMVPEGCPRQVEHAERDPRDFQG